MNVSKENPVIAWWSGGIASAVTCKICVDLFGKENVRVIFIDTKNEHEDTYRFLLDCEIWYGTPIEVATNPKYESIEDVWYDALSLNVATGAICSSELKRAVRQQLIKRNDFSYQAFGFDMSENKRIKGMLKNNSHLKPIFPIFTYTKERCIEVVQDAAIEVPQAYKEGFRNNNCMKTGCVQGGIGYWKMMKAKKPEQFDRMAFVEHDLTDLKGQPVTILKDQGKGGGLVFLKPHPKYPHIKDISMMKGRAVEPLMECNGFCNKHEVNGI